MQKSLYRLRHFEQGACDFSVMPWTLKNPFSHSVKIGIFQVFQSGMVRATAVWTGFLSERAVISEYMGNLGNIRHVTGESAQNVSSFDEVSYRYLIPLLPRLLLKRVKPDHPKKRLKQAIFKGMDWEALK